MAESPNDRLRLARERAGFRSASSFAAKHGITESTYRSAENGTRGMSLAAAKQYAPLLGVSWQWLLDGTSSMDPPPRSIADLPTNPLLTHDKLKVMGLAECGPDGFSSWNGEIVDWVPRPANLAGVKDAYAVFIIGDSMLPRYQPGEVAHINPARPVTPGAYVLVQKRARVEGDTPLAVIKRLARRSGDKVILEQLNPPKMITLPASDVVSMHRIVSSADA